MKLKEEIGHQTDLLSKEKTSQEKQTEKLRMEESLEQEKKII